MGRNSKLFQRRKAATEESLRRRSASREANKRVLIVCEGEKTERIYFEELVAHLRLVSVDVEICADGGSAPISVVEYAQRRALTEGLPEDAGYDAVFCVFDRDTHETYEAAKAKVLDLRKQKVFPAVAECAITSIPSFEYWFLLHFGYARAPFIAVGTKSAGARVLDELRKVAGFEAYEKNLSSNVIRELLGRTEEAMKNAARAAADAEATGEENPSTLVPQVVGYLQALKAPKH